MKRRTGGRRVQKAACHLRVGGARDRRANGSGGREANDGLEAEGEGEHTENHRRSGSVGGATEVTAEKLCQKNRSAGARGCPGTFLARDERSLINSALGHHHRRKALGAAAWVLSEDVQEESKADDPIIFLHRHHLPRMMHGGQGCAHERGVGQRREPTRQPTVCACGDFKIQYYYGASISVH